MPTNSTKRRLALKTLGGSALAGGLADKLPAIWQRPLVESAALPAHAQVSAEMGRIRLVINHTDPNLGDAVTVSLTYEVRRNTNDRITTVTFPSGTALVAGADPHTPTLWQALFPAAYAQVTPAPQATPAVVQPPPPPGPSRLRLMEDLALDFTGGAMEQSGMLSLSYDGFNCDGFEVRVSLIRDRTGISRIDAGTAQTPGGTARSDCGTAYQITADTSPGSGFGYIIGPTPQPGPGTTATAAPSQTTLPPPPEAVEGQIGLVVTDTANNAMATMVFEYRVQRDRANRIDTMRFPATVVAVTMHQPAAKVLGILFPTAQAQQAEELHLIEEVLLTFTDNDLDQTAMFPLRYGSTDCIGTFDVEVTLYPSRTDIQSIIGSSNITECGNITIDPGAGFGTFTPSPTLAPTTTPTGPTGTPGPTTTAEPTTTAAPTAPPTTVQITSIGFMESSLTLSVLEGSSVDVVVTVTGRAEVTFDMVRVGSSSTATGADLASGTPLAGVGLNTDGDNYNLTGITVPAGAGSITIPLMAASDSMPEAGGEILTFQLQNPRASTQGDVAMIDTANSQVMISIFDADKPLVQFAQDEYQVLEGETIDIEFDIQGWEHAAHARSLSSDSDFGYAVGFVVSRDANTGIMDDFSVRKFGNQESYGTVRPRDAADFTSEDETDPGAVTVVLVEQRNKTSQMINAGRSSSTAVDTPNQNEGGVRFRFTASTDTVAEAGGEPIVFRIDPADTREFTYYPGGANSRNPSMGARNLTGMSPDFSFTYKNDQINVGPRREVTIRIYDNPVVGWSQPAYEITEPDPKGSVLVTDLNLTNSIDITPSSATQPSVYFRIMDGPGVETGASITDYEAGTDDYFLRNSNPPGQADPTPIPPLGLLRVLNDPSRNNTTIRLIRDQLTEPNETITLTLVENPVDANAYTVDPMKATATITLIDNPPPPTTASPTTPAPPTAAPTTTGEPVVTTTGTPGIPAGERWFRYTWMATPTGTTAVYNIEGEFRLMNPPAVGTTITESNVYYHVMSLSLTVDGGTTAHTLDLVNDEFNNDNSSHSNTSHQFSFVLPAVGATGTFSFANNPETRSGTTYTDRTSFLIVRPHPTFDFLDPVEYGMLRFSGTDSGGNSLSSGGWQCWIQRTRGDSNPNVTSTTEMSITELTTP